MRKSRVVRGNFTGWLFFHSRRMSICESRVGLMNSSFSSRFYRMSTYRDSDRLKSYEIFSCAHMCELAIDNNVMDDCFYIFFYSRQRNFSEQCSQMCIRTIEARNAIKFKRFLCNLFKICLKLGNIRELRHIKKLKIFFNAKKLILSY